MNSRVFQNLILDSIQQTTGSLYSNQICLCSRIQLNKISVPNIEAIQQKKECQNIIICKGTRYYEKQQIKIKVKMRLIKEKSCYHNKPVKFSFPNIFLDVKENQRKPTEETIPELFANASKQMINPKSKSKQVSNHHVNTTCIKITKNYLNESLIDDKRIKSQLIQEVQCFKISGQLIIISLQHDHRQYVIHQDYLMIMEYYKNQKQKMMKQSRKRVNITTIDKKKQFKLIQIWLACFILMILISSLLKIVIGFNNDF